MNQPEINNDNFGEFVIYTTDDGHSEVHLRLINGSVWLAQKEMADLFNVNTSAISKHLKNIYADGELNRQATVSKLENVALEQGRTVHRSIEHYNLDGVPRSRATWRTISAVGNRGLT